MLYYKRLFSLIVVALIAGLGPVSAADLKKAPDFTLTDLDGKTVTLSKNAGKVVFLDFWASWCPPCRNSIPAVAAMHEKLQKKDVVIVGINLEDNPKATKAFAARNGMKYTIVVDTEDIARQYNVRGIPAFFLINQKGEIAKSYVGFQPGMEEQWEHDITTLLQQGEKTKSAPAAPSKKRTPPKK